MSLAGLQSRSPGTLPSSVIWKIDRSSWCCGCGSVWWQTTRRGLHQNWKTLTNRSVYTYMHQHGIKECTRILESSSMLLMWNVFRNCPVDRRPRGKWRIQLSTFCYYYWPTFCEGIAFVMTMNFVTSAYQLVHRVPRVWLDDVSVFALSPCFACVNFWFLYLVIFSVSLSVNLAIVNANGVELLLSPSVGLCVYLPVCRYRKCSVAKRLIGSGCHLGWWVGRSRDGRIRWVVICQRQVDILGVNLGRPIVTNGDFVA